MIDTIETRRGLAMIAGMTPSVGQVPDRIVEELGSYSLQVERLLVERDASIKQYVSLLDQLKLLAAVVAVEGTT